MQRCPRCGYREVDGPAMLSVLAFGALYIVFTLATDRAPRSLRLIGLIAFFIFLAAISWRAFGDEKNRRAYLKLHPSPGERVKGHTKSADPN
jgi:hypothetical protein